LYTNTNRIAQKTRAGIGYFFRKPRGIIIGFVVAAPAGPVSILCIRRTLTRGRFQGFATGLGATIGDGFYAAIAAFGLSFVINFLTTEEFWFRLLGGIFLAAMGFYILYKKRKPENFKEPKKEGENLGEAFCSALLLDLANPIIIFAYIAIFSGFGLATAEQHLFSGMIIVVGVIIGAALWWFLLTQIVAFNRDKLRPESIVTVSRIAGLLLIGFGVLVLVTTVFHLRFFGRTF